MLRAPSHDAVIARLALLLLDHGMIPASCWVRTARRLATVCRESLSDWIDSRAGRLQVLKPGFGVTLRQSDSLDCAGALWVAWWPERVACLSVGPAMDVLSALHPGLPGTVLAAIHKAGWNAMPVFGFDEQLDFCECYVWGGCSDEIEYAELCGIDEDEMASFLQSTIRRSDVERGTPQRAFAYRRERFKSDRSLARFKHSVSLFPVRRILELVREIQAIDTAWIVKQFHEEASVQGSEFVGYGAVLRWSESDHTIDVLEAFGQSGYESGVSYEDCCVHGQALDDGEAFAGFLGQLSLVLDSMRCVDELLWLLSAEEWSTQPLWR